MLGITQQQLGERLNLSPQAISKWENDLAEPDLATLKMLAELYKVSIDELLDVNAPSAQNQNTAFDADAVADAVGEKIKMNNAIGFCKDCGITVTEETLGASEPYVICKKCLNLKKAAEAKAAAEAERKRYAEQKAREDMLCETKQKLKRKRAWSLVVAAIPALIVLIITFSSLSGGFDFGKLGFGLFLTYAVYAFVAMLFYDTAVTGVVSYMCSASIKWPGLIFSFDLDGFIWVICMKALFAVLGFLFGLVCSALGIILGIIIAPFVFPYIMVKFSKDIKEGVEGDYL